MTEQAPYVDTGDCIERTEWDADRPPSEAVVDAIASATGRDPLQIEPLHNYVETDALNALLAPRTPSDEPVQVTFSYEDLDVLVDSSGTIEVYSSPPGQ